MRRCTLLTVALTTGLAFAAGGCASSGRASGGDGASQQGHRASRIRPPEMVNRARPDLVTPRGAPREGRVVDIRVEVMIDEDGRPDMSTLQVTGMGAAENRVALAAWIEQSRFRPGTQDGKPVRAKFNSGFRAEVRRVQVSP